MKDVLLPKFSLSLLVRFELAAKSTWPEVICVPSASCVAMMRDHYPLMAEKTGDRHLKEEVAVVLPKVFELTELLVDKLVSPTSAPSIRTT